MLFLSDFACTSACEFLRNCRFFVILPLVTHVHGDPFCASLRVCVCVCLLDVRVDVHACMCWGCGFARYYGASEVVKRQNMNIMMSHKAYNGRIITEWLAGVTQLALSRNFALPDSRICGAWLSQQLQNGQPYPAEQKLPLQHVALPGA